jgi:two-component system chemotaxis response regulator CheB
MLHEPPIRVMVVDDSAFMRTALTRMIQSDPALRVVGYAIDGQEAIEKIPHYRPDVITMDIEMPRMTGLEALRKIMAESPRQVIMVSSLTQEGAHATFDALEAGAFDYIPKQLSYVSLDIIKIREELVSKIKAAAAIPVRTKPANNTVLAQPKSVPVAGFQRCYPSPTLVCIGSSTGGPRALQQILPKLPESLPVGILIVQHMPPGFTGPFAERLNGLCAIRVKEAEQEDWIEPGLALIAPAGWHAVPFRKTHSKYAVRLAKTPVGTLHTPSVDVMMLAAADLLKAQAMGVILTGMGNDGEQGMTAIYRAGGRTIGQDEATCTVYGMPRACALAGVLHKAVPLMQVPSEILSAARGC